MPKLPMLTLLKRFLSVVKQEGAGQAVQRAFEYVSRRVRGSGIGSVSLAAGSGAKASDQYLHGVWQALAQQEAFHVLQSPALERGRRQIAMIADLNLCLLYTSPSPRDRTRSRMPSSA